MSEDHQAGAPATSSEAGAELEQQARMMAEKALEALPEAARAAKLEKVKEGILKRLKEQAAAGPKPQAPPVAVSAPAAATPPVAPPPPSAPLPQQLVKLKGIEACGDEQWFASITTRRLLRESVAAAHQQQKILVGAPADEIRRICPGDGRTLGAGAVLRLGGVHLGGFGEADIAYAYRQLSRALHPDKNPDIPDAPNAFRRLTEAAEELRQGLGSARATLTMLCESLCSTLAPELLERPQEALFAEATRLLYAVLGASGEGEVPEHAERHALAAFAKSFSACQQRLFAEWFDQPRLLEAFTSAELRTAYDCAPKRLRAQFLCALNRVLVVEAKRQKDCVRGTWQAVMMQFPEMGVWRELRAKLSTRVWSGERGSRWDVDSQTSSWATRWRGVIRMVLPSSFDGAAPPGDTEFRKLATAIWHEVVQWARRTGAERPLALFSGEPSGRGDTQHFEWAFVPAADLMLVVGEGQVGLTAEGIFSDSHGHERRTLVQAVARCEAKRAQKEQAESHREEKGEQRPEEPRRAERGDRRPPSRSKSRSRARRGRASAAEKALEGCNGEDADSARIFVGNLPPDVTEDTLDLIFGRYGKILGFKIIASQHRREQSSAIVRFRKPSAADAAVAALNDRLEIRSGQGPLKVRLASASCHWD